MTATEQAEAAAGLDSATLAAHFAPIVERAIGAAVQVATCRKCAFVMMGTELPVCCPLCERTLSVRDFADVQQRPELLKAAASFELPEDSERAKADASAAARFTRREP